MVIGKLSWVLCPLQASPSTIGFRVASWTLLQVTISLAPLPLNTLSLLSLTLALALTRRQNVVHQNLGGDRWGGGVVAVPASAPASLPENNTTKFSLCARFPFFRRSM